MNEISDWLEWGFIGLLTILSGWAKSEHGKLTKQLDELEDSSREYDKRIALLEAAITNHKEHIDQRFDSLDKKIDKLFDRFEKYDHDREEFFKTFELKPRER